MSTAQILVLGAVAGLTIFLGLPMARMRAVSPGFKAFLGATATGILLFLFWDVLAAAVGIPSFGLFGMSQVLTYSRFIHPIVPDDGKLSPDGMQRISPSRVLEQIGPLLAAAPPDGR